MYSLFIINPISVLISLSTMFGIVLHDTKFDQMTTTYLTAPALRVSFDGATNVLSKMDHTHTERVSVSELGRSLAYESPRTQVRNDIRKHIMQKNVMRGHHPFDNYSLPILA
jgi:hypothetical protein